jgi:hypothetical protein
MMQVQDQLVLLQKMKTKMKYKNAFAKRLENRLAKVSIEKLEKVSTKIDVAVENIENSSMSEFRKEIILSQLAALKEIVIDELEGREGDILLEELLEK